MANSQFNIIGSFIDNITNRLNSVTSNAVNQSNRVNAAANVSSNSISSTFSGLTGVFGLVSGAIASIGFASLGSKIIENTAQWEKFQAVLTNTYGSASVAGDNLKMLSVK